eukprot:170522_1
MGCGTSVDSKTRGDLDTPEQKPKKSLLTTDDLWKELNSSNSASLLKKHLSKELFDQLKDLKTDKGCDLSQIIRSGCENLDSGVGLYAPDAESYKMFSPLFDKIIDDYHKGYDADSKHPPKDMDPSKLNTPNPDPSGKFVISSRIRVARNLSKYGLGPTLSKEDRLAIEKEVSEILQSLEGELAGKYYPLNSMDEKSKQQLVDDHFLFKKGDRFLESAGLNKHWPDGRGIFHNNEKTFLVWVNEEDELRIISMEQGGDIGGVFKRLSEGVAALESKMDFIFDDHLGFISSCPTNLGTGMRASVHIRIPYACKLPNFNEICESYSIQPRGIHGEHSETHTGVVDLSNKRRLGLSELDCVQQMYDGVVKIIELEKEQRANAQVLFDKLSASDSKSLLKKHLTPEVFTELKDLKTDNGITLADCIRSGCDNVDSGVGLYAPDVESYTVFAKLFNPLIDDYHKGFAEDATHPAKNMDIDSLNADNPDPDGEFVLSTRIRVARNLTGYPLTPALSLEDRTEIERNVVEALNTLEDELSGTYFPLSGMDEATRRQLVEDHFLFKKGDRFLESVGVNDYWPQARGIYHNEAKTFLVWVNEEDELRIISMEQGGDIKSVFARLSNAVAKLEEKLDFMFTDHLGFASACPTNLGTGMRASVHIKIPNACKLDNFKELCESYGIQPRGIHGEHSETNSGVVDLSNKRRLGLSELDCVQQMYDGVVKIIELEKEHSGGGGGAGDETQTLYTKLKESDATSLLKKHLTEEVFQELSGLKTTNGVSLADCIRSGCDNLDSGVGLYAPDLESYTMFAKLFDPLIDDYHKGFAQDATHPAKDMDAGKLEGWEHLDPDGKFIVSTRIRVARNLNNYPLTPALSLEQRTEIESKVVEALNTLEDELSGTYYALTGMDEATQKKLVEDHFLFKKGDRFLESVGVNNDWPNARGIFHNDSKTFLVWVNEEDELRIISMEQGGDIKSVFGRLCNAVAKLEEKLDFMFTDHLGFVSACPTNLGTGMRASVHIKIPNACKLDNFKELCESYGIQPRGIHGEHSETDSGVVDLSNKRRLGLSELDCVQQMYDGVVKIIELEKEHRGNVQSMFDKLSASDSKSLVKKHLTAEVFAELKDLKTDNGFTLADCIRSGCDNLDSGVGLYAPDLESYTVFASLFNPLIDDYHKGFPADATHPAKNMDIDALKADNPDPDGKFVISTRIRVARNLSGYPLTPGLSLEQRTEIESKVVEALNTLEDDLSGTYYPLDGMDEETRQKLVDDHFLFKKGDRFLESVGVNKFWPKSRGIFHNEAKTFLVWVNEEDELRIISMEQGGDIKSVFARLSKAVAKLEEKLDFMFTDHLGFASACPTNLGTGMRASVHIKIPNACKLDNFKELCESYGIQPRGIHGE